jgi:hypothetical protein
MRQPAGIDRTIALGLLGAGALVGVAAPAASAAQAHPSEWSRIGQIKLYPLAGSAVDPLSNSLGTNLSGLPLSTAPVNAVFSNGLPMHDLPLVGGLLTPAAGAHGDVAAPADTGTGTDAADVTNATAPNAAAPNATAPFATLPFVTAPVADEDAADAAEPAEAAPGAAAVRPATQPPLFGPLQ